MKTSSGSKRSNARGKSKAPPPNNKTIDQFFKKVTYTKPSDTPAKDVDSTRSKNKEPNNENYNQENVLPNPCASAKPATTAAMVHRRPLSVISTIASESPCGIERGPRRTKPLFVVLRDNEQDHACQNQHHSEDQAVAIEPNAHADKAAVAEKEAEDSSICEPNEHPCQPETAPPRQEKPHVPNDRTTTKATTAIATQDESDSDSTDDEIDAFFLVKTKRPLKHAAFVASKRPQITPSLDTANSADNDLKASHTSTDKGKDTSKDSAPEVAPEDIPSNNSSSPIPSSASASATLASLPLSAFSVSNSPSFPPEVAVFTQPSQIDASPMRDSAHTPSPDRLSVGSADSNRSRTQSYLEQEEFEQHIAYPCPRGKTLLEKLGIEAPNP